MSISRLAHPRTVPGFEVRERHLTLAYTDGASLARRLRAAIGGAALIAGCAADPNGRVERRTIVERTPYGTKTTVVTTRSSVREPPPPPPRPADPLPGDPLPRYNLDLLNEYRAHAGLHPLLYDATISAFALAGSRQLARDHSPHAHFVAHIQGAQGFGSRSAENQGDPNGVPPMAGDAVSSGKRQVALMLKMMFDEGPGGGHHDNMLNARYRRVGIGLYEASGTLYLTNDFSD